MIFHEIRLLADNSNEISFPISFENYERCKNKYSSAAVVIGALRVNLRFYKVKINKEPSFIK